jgi:hypothetical protein
MKADLQTKANFSIIRVDAVWQQLHRYGKGDVVPTSMVRSPTD